MIDLFGWSEALQAAFAPHAAQGFVPARVLAQHRGLWRVITAEGERTARLAQVCGATVIIQPIPKRSVTMPKRGEKNVLPIGIWIWPSLASASKARSASAQPYSDVISFSPRE